MTLTFTIMYTIVFNVCVPRIIIAQVPVPFKLNSTCAGLA